MDYKKNIRYILDNRSKILYIDFLKKKFSKYNHICIFGMGNLGQGTMIALEKEGIKIDFFCDNDSKKIGTKFKNIKCISLEELKKIKNETIIIIAARFYKEIYNQLKIEGFENLERVFSNKFEVDNYFSENNNKYIRDKIMELLDILEDQESKRVISRIIEEWFNHEYRYGQLDDIFLDNQYFYKDIVKLSENEFFVDGGAYIGDTLEDFLENSKYKFGKIFLFELNTRIFKELQKNIIEKFEDLEKEISSYNVGLSNRDETIFYDDCDEGSSIDKDGKNKGEITSLDKILSSEKVTFIKMDIEGAEMEALQGAKNIIKKYKPKLAICLYHKPDDLWEIPIYIKKLMPEYKIYIRHHTDLLNETVCYAIPK